MPFSLTRRPGLKKQFLFSISLIVLVSLFCYFLSPYIGFRGVALILLVCVSLIAVSFDIWPVLISAALSAFIWDFFFIPPRFTLHVDSTDDVILLVMYFIIAMVNAVLTYKIRRVEKQARQKEEKANAVKLYNTVFSSLSHELRTPISAIIAATDNLQESPELTEPNKTQLVSEISKAAFRLNQQVENLLNLSRLESGFIRPKAAWSDINDLVYTIVSRIEGPGISQKIRIHVNPELPLVEIDKGMLEQVLANLLKNAVLYTPPSSVIDISAMVHADILELIVEDNGRGFPGEDLEKIFDKFYRAKESQAGGIGLGLSIVKGFTEALGGTIMLVNKSTGGAKFIISIPVKTSYMQV
jgi:two-component system sensor histidine kinase KdpD